MTTYASHTIVKNGMPFIGKVIEQVIPVMSHCYITLSEKSDDGTLEVIKKLQDKYGNRIVLNFENVEKPADLTKERQKQVDQTKEDWILFLDDDDWWPRGQFLYSMTFLKDELDGLAVRPYQLIDQNTQDATWENRWFTKWIRKKPGLIYKDPWPKDLAYIDGAPLFWKKNKKVLRVNARYYHLSYLKGSSFRNEEWAKKYAHKSFIRKSLPLEELKEVAEVFNGS